MSRQNNHLHICHAMSHAQSLLLPCLTSSAHSTRTPHPTSLLFPSHEDDHCDDPGHGATFGQLAESITLTDAVSALCPRLKRQRKSRIELTSLQILCTSSNEEKQENAMDQRNGSFITGRPQILFEIAGKENMSLLRKGGSRTEDYRDTQQIHGLDS